jgi:hypothetical protein
MRVNQKTINAAKIKELNKEIEIKSAEGLAQLFRFHGKTSHEEDKNNGDPRCGDLGTNVFSAKRWVKPGQCNGQGNEDEEGVGGKKVFGGGNRHLQERRTTSLVVTSSTGGCVQRRCFGRHGGKLKQILQEIWNLLTRKIVTKDWVSEQRIRFQTFRVQVE